MASCAEACLVVRCEPLLNHRQCRGGALSKALTFIVARPHQLLPSFPAYTRARIMRPPPAHALCLSHAMRDTRPAPRPSPSPNTPCKRAARASDAASARGGSTISAASVDISCSACALLERRHVASSRTPPQQNFKIITRCPRPLRIPLKPTASAPFFPYFQA
jgi:hypothetical protein